MVVLITSIVALIILTSAVRGARVGFGVLAVNFGGLVLATIAASISYIDIAHWLRFAISAPIEFLNLATFVAVWLLVASLYKWVLFTYRPRPMAGIERQPTAVSRVFGAALAAIQAILVVTISLLVLLALPIGSGLKNELGRAPLASEMIAAGSRYQQQVNGLVSDLSQTLSFLSVRPKSEESIKLGFHTTNVSVDEAGERQMLILLNRERTRRGLSALVIDDQLTAVARKHSRDMFARGYFSHVTPDGIDPFQRMRDGGVKFVAAGENLALAPTVELAHNGLMNSREHKANILEPSFRRIGIGVIDGGIYGEMFTQDFAD